MRIKEEKGITGIDIVISIIIITIFIALMANIIAHINLNSKDTERKSRATSYAVQEIERLKIQGYADVYNGRGIEQKELIRNKDIVDKEGNFTGYNINVYIKDYVLIANDNTKQPNLVKEITVEVSYRLGKEDKSIEISTYITKE